MKEAFIASDENCGYSFTGGIIGGSLFLDLLGVAAAGRAISRSRANFMLFAVSASQVRIVYSEAGVGEMGPINSPQVESWQWACTIVMQFFFRQVSNMLASVERAFATTSVYFVATVLRMADSDTFFGESKGWTRTRVFSAIVNAFDSVQNDPVRICHSD
jgi:hypothetical protein